MLAEVMRELKTLVRPGITTKALNDKAEGLINEGGGKPAFKGYRAIPGGTKFPSALCASVNDVVVHGPAISDEPLQEGDIIGLDLGINLEGYYSDMAVTLPVGEISAETRQLLDVTKKSLENGIAVIGPRKQIFDISKAVEDTIKPHNYGIIRSFAGHGVGLNVHEDPWIPNYVDEQLKGHLNVVMKPGMVFAIEPMVTMGSEEVEILDDAWSVRTADGSLTAHFEHSVLVTEDGHEILTKL